MNEKYHERQDWYENALLVSIFEERILPVLAVIWEWSENFGGILLRHTSSSLNGNHILASVVTARQQCIIDFVLRSAPWIFWLLRLSSSKIASGSTSNHAEQFCAPKKKPLHIAHEYCNSNRIACPAPKN